MDKKDGKQKRRSPVSKNTLYRALLSATKRNQIPFRYVLSDVWYSAAENMMFIKHDLGKDFIMPLKAKRKVAWSEQAKRDGQWVRLDQLTLEAHTPLEIYLESVDFKLLLTKQVFANEDGSTGIQYLVSSERTLTAEAMTTLLNDRVLPCFESQEVKLLRILTDRGTEYLGSQQHHEYERYLALENIDPSKTKARSPQTNGITERFQKTIGEEFYAVAFRKKIYTSLEMLQADGDEWVEPYNRERTHTGKYCFGRTPLQTFRDTNHLAQAKLLDTLFEAETQNKYSPDVKHPDPVR